MRASAAFSTMGWVALLGASASAQVSPPSASQAPPSWPGGAPTGAAAPRNGGAVNAEAPLDPNDDPQLSPEDYATGIDYDTTYDDSVANTYDDGYDPQAYQQFTDTLSPYGAWVDDPSYGRVWVPSQNVVGADFSPYGTNGDWVDSEYGWTWVSAWAWGWAPFHYGRWAVMGNRGWGWVPGTLWGPAWVSWREGGGYAGWAPLPPRGVSLGSPLGPRSPWRFTATRNLGRTHGAYLSPRMVPAIFGRTMVVSNARVLSDGPNGANRGSAVRVNVGPSVAGAGGGARAAPVKLAGIAPRALPRVAIRPRTGTAVAGRPWVQNRVTSQTAGYRGDGRGEGSALRPGDVGSSSASVGAREAPGRGGYEARGRYEARGGLPTQGRYEPRSGIEARGGFEAQGRFEPRAGHGDYEARGAGNLSGQGSRDRRPIGYGHLEPRARPYEAPVPTQPLRYGQPLRPVNPSPSPSPSPAPSAPAPIYRAAPQPIYRPAPQSWSPPVARSAPPSRSAPPPPSAPPRAFAPSFSPSHPAPSAPPFQGGGNNGGRSFGGGGGGRRR